MIKQPGIDPAFQSHDIRVPLLVQNLLRICARPMAVLAKDDQQRPTIPVPRFVFQIRDGYLHRTGNSPGLGQTNVDQDRRLALAQT